MMRLKKLDIVLLCIPILALLYILGHCVAWALRPQIVEPVVIEPPTAVVEKRLAPLSDTTAPEPLEVSHVMIVEPMPWMDLVPEIEAHLVGRPLQAYSVEIAKACYETGMSPYWFCTIAIVESGGGANCFRSCNAWGYGQYSWATWEEAIPSFASMFVSGYGSGLTAASHLTYCPGGAYAAYV